MSTRDHFLRALAADPADDAVRLVFADWLEEQGDPADLAWSELIRTQIRLAALPPWHDDVRALEVIAEELEQQYRSVWLRDVPTTIHVGGFERGLPARFGPRGGNYYDWQLKDEHLPALAQALERFPITTFSGRMLGSPLHEWQERDKAYPESGQTGLEKLAAWPGLSRLESLQIGYGGVGETMGNNSAGLAALASSPYAKNLTTLDLSGLNLTDDDLFALATSLPKLHSLDLWYNDDLRLTNFARTNNLINTPLVHHLLVLKGIEAVGAAELLDYLGQDSRLRHLEVDFDIYDEHVLLERSAWYANIWLQANALSSLRHLDLQYYGPALWEDRSPEHDEMLEVEGLGDLLASPRLAHLETLSLAGFRLADAGFRRLLQAPLAANVIDLTAERCGITGHSLPALRAFLATGRVRRLNLGSNLLKNEDAFEIATWPELARLHYLWLDFNDEIEEEGFDAIMESPYRHPHLYLSG